MPLGMNPSTPAAAPGGPGPAPGLPKSPVGGPGGPGASPMMSPGGGAGNKAAATQQVKAVIPALLIASMAFDAGSKEQQALLRAISSLNPIFGKAEGANMVPAGLATMAQAASKGPLSAAPPPGISPSPTPPPNMEIPGASSEEAGA